MCDCNQQREQQFLVLRPENKHQCELPPAKHYLPNTVLRCNICHTWWFNHLGWTHEPIKVWEWRRVRVWHRRRRADVARRLAHIEAEKAAKDFPANLKLVESFPERNQA